MSTIISPFVTFPNISWWASALKADTVILDAAEHFQKMTTRNRYYISGANNAILLSVPLVSGRNQHIPMRDVRIHNEDKWQVRHWRTLVSVYKRSPYFEHYEDSLVQLFKADFTFLTDFNRASVIWVKEQLGIKFALQETDAYIKQYDESVADLRNFRYKEIKEWGSAFPKYYQVFEDRTGFLADLSILDLMFSEGPASMAILQAV